MPAPTKPTAYMNWTDGNVTKVIAPPGSLQLTGWLSGMRPAFRYINWLFWLADTWTQWLDYISNPVNVTITNATGPVTIAYPTKNLIAFPTADYTATLPLSSANKGHRIMIKNESGSGHTITVAAAGADTIEGSNTSLPVGAGEFMELMANGGTRWGIVGQG